MPVPAQRLAGVLAVVVAAGPIAVASTLPGDLGNVQTLATSPATPPGAPAARSGALRTHRRGPLRQLGRRGWLPASRQLGAAGGPPADVELDRVEAAPAATAGAAPASPRGPRGPPATPAS
jgi:hypothetical protein